MKLFPYEVSDKRKLRVIIDTDAGCEADDQYAIAHALMSAKLEVRGIMAEHFGHIPGSMEQSLGEIKKVTDLMGIDNVPVLEGAQGAMADERTPSSSEASRFLVQEALRNDERPLAVLCQGALTNVAAALLEDPQICSRIHIILIGGVNYPTGGYEFNTMNDPAAFNAVMNSGAAVWAVPEEVYATMQTGMMELYERVASCGEIGKYLYEKTAQTAISMAQMIPGDPNASALERAIAFPNGESWSLGDSPAVGILLMHHAGEYREVAAPNVKPDGTYFIPDQNRRIRWYTTINQRFVLEDFFAKLSYFYK